MPLLRYATLFMLFILAGCAGYSFGPGEASVLPPQYRVLAIDEVVNPTTLPWLEPRLRKLLRDEMNNRGTFAWTDQRDKADAVITIDIERYYRPTAVEDSDERTLLTKAVFRFNATIRSTTDESVLWNSGRITENWPYDYGNGEEADMEVTKRGIQRLADLMTEDY